VILKEISGLKSFQNSPLVTTSSRPPYTRLVKQVNPVAMPSMIERHNEMATTQANLGQGYGLSMLVFTVGLIKQATR
jgi:hypothetical protein